MKREKCPFRVGDELVYKPRPQSQVPERKTEPQLEKGMRYKMVGIDADECVILEGFENEGGIYWDDFQKVVVVRRQPDDWEIKKKPCPYKVGETVVYRPSSRGHDLDIMIDPQFQKGKSYKIVRIVNDVYIVVEGFENAVGGAVYWSEFSALKPGECPFNVGDTVVYQPGVKKGGLGGMLNIASLKPGNKYKIAKIENDVSVVVEGVRSGIPWTEFQKHVEQMLPLGDKWKPVINTEPETGTGFQLASVVLRDGRRFDRTTIVGDTIMQVNGKQEVPFSEDEIADIKITHGKDAPVKSSEVGKKQEQPELAKKPEAPKKSEPAKNVAFPVIIMVTAKGDVKPGLAVRLRFGMNKKNDYHYKVYLDAGGRAEVTRRTLLKAFDAVRAKFPENHENARIAFTGQIEARVLSESDVKKAIESYQEQNPQFSYPEDYLIKLVRAITAKLRSECVITVEQSP